MNTKTRRTDDFVSTAQTAAAGYMLLEDESERGSVLVGGAMLDETLGALLRVFLGHDHDIAKSLIQLPNAPLSTFSSRIRISRALNLVSPQLFNDLDRIRTIRNAAAHFDRKGTKGLHFSFEDPDVAQRCAALDTIPGEFRKIFPPRTLFEMFASLVSAVFSQYVASIRDLAQTKGQSEVVRRLLVAMPAMDYLKLFERFADEILTELASEAIRELRPNKSSKRPVVGRRTKAR